MKTIILCMLTLFVASAVKAQSSTALLNITLTEVQSVTFIGEAENTVFQEDQELVQNESLQVLSRSASQIKKIYSNTSEYARLYNEFYSRSASKTTSSANSIAYSAELNIDASRSSMSPKHLNLVIYQVDPR